MIENENQVKGGREGSCDLYLEFWDPLHISAMFETRIWTGLHISGTVCSAMKSYRQMGNHGWGFQIWDRWRLSICSFHDQANFPTKIA